MPSLPEYAPFQANPWLRPTQNGVGDFTVLWQDLTCADCRAVLSPQNHQSAFSAS